MSSVGGATPARQLFLTFHGRVLEHLGVQMYQSPVNAIAELIANAWDADAPSVDVALPAALGTGEVLTVTDTGKGMTFEDCQNYYLNVGRNRRRSPSERTAGGRALLGRKGIGKFAGFGIAQVITINTVSELTGERTVFTLDLQELMSGGEYINVDRKPVTVLEALGPDDARQKEHGTRIELSKLTMRQVRDPEKFSVSMARRFLMLNQQAGFAITVNGSPLPDALDAAGVQYNFPLTYTATERGATTLENDWGVDTLPGGQQVRWRLLFMRSTIEDEELRGVAIYAGVKLAQRPFFFNLTQGVTAQAGLEYLAGQVEADFLDVLPDDIISTERQRVNWDHESASQVIKWGQDKIRKALTVWRDRRGEVREAQLDDKVEHFATRLAALQSHERAVVKRALRQLAKISTMTDDQFANTADAVLTAWEGGRLKDLIHAIAESESIDEGAMLQLLFEVNVLTALNMAEAVVTKLRVVQGLKQRIIDREKENPLRDYIAENPWLIAPEWDTFRRERGLKQLCEDAAKKAKWDATVYPGRVDLTLGSGTQLLLLEFMRPGERLDFDHISRWDRYVKTLRLSLRAQTGQQYQSIAAYLVADELDGDPVLVEMIAECSSRHQFAMDWATLLDRSLARWKDLLESLVARAPEDPRLGGLSDLLDDMLAPVARRPGDGSVPTPEIE